MALHFRPRPGLTIVTAIALAILIGLGTWQYKRLQWKNALLQEVEEANSAPPFDSLEELTASLNRGESIDFRRIGMTGTFKSDDPEFHVYSPGVGEFRWRPFVTFEQDGMTLFAALSETVPDSEKTSSQNSAISGEAYVSGYVRKARSENKFSAKNSPERNRWFGFNPEPDVYNWGEQVRGEVEMRAYIDIVSNDINAADLPQKRPDIANNHFDYMLTWYGLALTLLVIYLIFHRREGRLGWR